MKFEQFAMYKLKVTGKVKVCGLNGKTDKWTDLKQDGPNIQLEDTRILLKWQTHQVDAKMTQLKI